MLVMLVMLVVVQHVQALLHQKMCFFIKSEGSTFFDRMAVEHKVPKEHTVVTLKGKTEKNTDSTQVIVNHQRFGDINLPSHQTKLK